jgi:hypothetical protein
MRAILIPLKALFLVLRGFYVFFVLLLVATEMCMDRIDGLLARYEAASPEASEPVKVYGAVRPWLSRYLPTVSRMLHAARQGLGIYWSHSLFNRKLCKPTDR